MVEKLKLYLILFVSLLLIVVSNYMHEYTSLSADGHFSAGEGFLLGIAGVWKWARLRDQANKKILAGQTSK